MKHNNIHTIGIPEGGEGEQGIENLFEKVMTENFPKLIKQKVRQVQEGHDKSNHGESKDAHSKIHHTKTGKT